MPAPVTITSLLCHSHVPMALKCFGSLRRCHRPAFQLTIHDDGTLTDEDCARLVQAHPDATFIRRAEADDPVLAALEKYPVCRRYRAQHPMALKLFDVPLLAGGQRLVYSDADVYFLRPFTGFHRLWETTDARFIFPRDIESVYALRWFHLFGKRRLRFIRRLNAGIMLVDSTALDLDRLEFVLSRLDLGLLPNLIEQTCWAALAGSQPKSCRLLSPAQVNYPLSYPGRPEGIKAVPTERVALHFVTFLRARLAWMDEPEELDRLALPTLDLETIPASLLSAPEYLYHRLGKQVRYWRNKFA